MSVRACKEQVNGTIEPLQSHVLWNQQLHAHLLDEVVMFHAIANACFDAIHETEYPFTLSRSDWNKHDECDDQQQVLVPLMVVFRHTKGLLG